MELNTDLPNPLHPQSGYDGLYRPPLWLRGGHTQSILPTFFRDVSLDPSAEERLPTGDGDELSLDWHRRGRRRAVIITHGLEGHKRRHYMLGMARMALAMGWDAVTWNMRSCGDEMNKLARYYHSGSTDDLHRVVSHVLTQGYESVALVGFSMGGNITLLYLSEQGETADPRLAGGVGISVPCDLAGSAEVLAKPSRRVYMRRFIRDLAKKIRYKSDQFPHLFDPSGVEQIRTFKEFDQRYTAPVHGFDSAEDYWARCSSLPRLRGITTPALLLNARNDPFLSDQCFPESPATLGPAVEVCYPEWGGHVGFMDRNSDGFYWSERRVAAFLKRFD